MYVWFLKLIKMVFIPLFSAFEFLSRHVVWPTECSLNCVAEAGHARNWEVSGRVRKGLGQGLEEPQGPPAARRAPSAAATGSWGVTGKSVCVQI